MISRIAPAVPAGRAAAVDGGCNVGRCDAVFSCGIRHALKTFSIGTDHGANNNGIAALISPLMGKWNPGTIVRGIIAVIVAALNRKIVAIAIGKRPIAEWYEQKPFVADRDATSTVVLKSCRPWITASIEHATPNPRKPGSTAAMHGVQFSVDVYVPTSAGFCMASSQKLADHNGFTPARTTATPQRSLVSAADALDRGQSTERLASDINDLGHGDLVYRLLCQVTGWRFNAGPSRILAQSIIT